MAKGKSEKPTPSNFSRPLTVAQKLRHGSKIWTVARKRFEQFEIDRSSGPFDHRPPSASTKAKILAEEILEYNAKTGIPEADLKEYVRLARQAEK